MSELGGRFDEPSARRLMRSRRYSPANRAHGLRRIPDEPIGFTFFSSLILHAVLVLSLVHITVTLPEKPGADFGAIFMDLVEAAPDLAPHTHVPTPRPVPRGKQLVADRPAAKKATIEAAGTASSRSTLGASPPIVARPASAAPPQFATTKLPAGAPPTFDIDTPLETGWLEPPPTAFASPNPIQPAKRLTSVPLLRDSVEAAATQVAVAVAPDALAVEAPERTSETAVLLRPEANELRAGVTGPTGLEAEDAVTVQHVRRPSANGIVLTSPSDGLTVGPDDPPVAVVEGEIYDKGVATVWIVANDRRIPVPTSRGRFRHILLLPDPLVQLWAETSTGDAVHRSRAVNIRMAGERPPSGVLVMQWPAGTEESSVEVTATWRAHPERLDTFVQPMRLPAVGTGADGAPSDMFYLRALKSGVYTLIVRYRGAAPLGDARPTLYLPDKDHLTPRTLGPIPLNGAGRRVLTKILMPHAVLWNQDDWFSGRSESVDAVTKFRIPEGISWVERKADLP
jgi:hypothetical protein